MTLDLGPISIETFLATYWRRRPLHVPGGARRVLETTVEPAQFLAACARLERLAPHLIYRRGPELAFAQRIDLADGALHRVCERFAGWMSGAQIWFDGVYAREGMGIGSHFDLADTFLLQQRGTKVWRLHPPSFLPDEAIRQRLLNETIAAMYMPDGALEIRLDEGDLLYLPLLWVHWGISEGESLSLSLTLTARLGLECLDLAGLDLAGLAAGGAGAGGAAARARASLWCAGYPQPTPTQVPAGRPLPASVREAVVRDPRWWRPIPIVWAIEGEASAEAATRAEAERHIEALAAALPELAGAWADPTAAEPAAAAAPLERPATPERPAPLPELEELLRDAAALPDPKVDPASLAAPDTAGGEAELLRQRVARRCTGRFLRIVERSHEWIRNEELRATLSTLVRALARMAPEQRAQALSHTALRGWIWRAAEAIQFAYVPRLEAIARELPRLLLPSRPEASVPAWPGGPPILGDDDWIHGCFPAPARARGLA
ncbi:MAG TPA: cupin domain-containing protein, partial [Kofleriaceae bacterium]|nr:cupin domain-containing protein [Kofleriaceae bacterium]